MARDTFAHLASVVLRMPPRLGRVRLVAVDGPSGAGKTRSSGSSASGDWTR